MCCRAGIGVIIGVIVNATVESKQKNLLIRLPGVQTGLVGRLSRSRVPCQAWVQELQTEYNRHTVRPKHWHGSQGFTSVVININISTPAKRNAFMEAWLISVQAGEENLGDRNTVSPAELRINCHGHKLENVPCFPFCLTVSTWFFEILCKHANH